MTHKRRTPAWTKFTAEQLAALPRNVADTKVQEYYFGAECKHGHNTVRQRTAGGSQCMACVRMRTENKKNEIVTAKPKKELPKAKMFMVLGMMMPMFTDKSHSM